MGVIKTVITIIKTANRMLNVHEYIYDRDIRCEWGPAICCEDSSLEGLE